MRLNPKLPLSDSFMARLAAQVILRNHFDMKSAVAELRPDIEQWRAFGRKPDLHERVLLHPGTREPLSVKRIYERMKALGRRAGVANVHPHRFRDTFAVDMLARGASPYDVAKLLGDTISMVEKHYAPFVKELRERTRRFIENGEGLEKPSGTIWAQSTGITRRLQ